MLCSAASQDKTHASLSTSHAVLGRHVAGEAKLACLSSALKVHSLSDKLGCYVTIKSLLLNQNM
jgi:hypothetical protein